MCHWYTAGTHLQRRPHSQTSEGLGKGGAPITRNTRGIKEFKNKEHRASARQKAADPPIPSRLAKILQILSEGTPSPHPRKITAAMRREDTGHRDRKRGRNRCPASEHSLKSIDIRPTAGNESKKGLAELPAGPPPRDPGNGDSVRRGLNSGGRRRSNSSRIGCE